MRDREVWAAPVSVAVTQYLFAMSISLMADLISSGSSMNSASLFAQSNHGNYAGHPNFCTKSEKDGDKEYHVKNKVGIFAGYRRRQEWEHAA